MRRLLIIVVMLLVIPVVAMGACPFISDDFNDGTINSKWMLDARDGTIGESDGMVQMTSGSGNLWHDVFTPTWLYQCIDGTDFDVVTSLTIASMTAQYQQTGLLYQVDNNGWVAVVLRWNTTGFSGLAVQRRDSVGATTVTSQLAASPTNGKIWLRMKRVGSTFTTYFSNTQPETDSSWTEVDHGSLEYTHSGSQAKLGLIAMHPGATVFTTQFHAITMSQVVTEPADVVTKELKFAWEHSGKDTQERDVTVVKFPFYMTRTSGSNYTHLADVPVVGAGPTYTTPEVIEFTAVEGETLYFAVSAVSDQVDPDGNPYESDKSEEVAWTVPITPPPPPDPVCGDGVVNQDSEDCDDGNLVSGDGCSDCKVDPPPPPDPICGDGVINQASEDCDDGNLVAGDGCSNCKIDPVAPSQPKTVRIIITVEVPEGVDVEVKVVE